MLERIQSLVRDGRFPEAIGEIDRLCAAHPGRPDPWLAKASIHAQAGDLAGVITACERVLDLQPGNTSARYNLAVALQMLGRREAAMVHYRAIPAGTPQHTAAATNLGALYRDAGMLDEALSVLEQTVEHQPAFAPARNSLGLVYCDLGRHDDAMAQFRAALELQPGAPAAPINIARTHWKRGDTDGALTQLNDLLRRHPALTDAHLIKAQILDDTNRHEDAIEQLRDGLKSAPRDHRLHFELAQRLGRAGHRHDAIGHYRAAIDSNPNDYQSLNNLGALLHSIGRSEEGIETLARALKINPDSLQVHINLCVLHAACGNDIEAQEHCLRALRLQPGRRDILQRFAQIVGGARRFAPGADFDRALLACFDDPGVDQQNLTGTVLTMLMSTPGIVELCSRCRRSEAPGYAAFAALWSGDRAVFLERLLVRTVVPSADLEYCLRAYRRAALEHFVSADGLVGNTPSEKEAARLLALAHQCYNNEFVYDMSPEEAVRSAALEAAVYRPDPPDAAPPWIRHVLLAMYRPLRDVPAILGAPDGVPGAAAGLHAELLKKHIHDARREARIKQELPQLTPIAEGTSEAVRDQYEESPYPRWLSLDIQTPRHYATVMRETFPHFDPPDFGSDRIETLIAGCGTGKHAILSATRFADCAVTAVDLSRSSLAYGKRSAEELGIGNIDFHCGDILQLGGIGRTFHVIESVGVLHHLADPGRGLSVLRGLLKPQGLMNLGFYSATARRAVQAARTYYGAENGLPGLDDIRRARGEMLALPADHPIHPVTGTLDFYSLSDCRDLLFHTQETCYTLPDIAALLERNRLDFVGFELPDTTIKTRYLHDHPDDADMTDLRNWDRFEQEHPDTFIGMYVFWCQARD